MSLIFSRPWNQLNTDLLNAARQMGDPGEGSGVCGAAPAVGPDQGGEPKLISISGSRLSALFLSCSRVKKRFPSSGEM